jgi:hypothetical protein
LEIVKIHFRAGELMSHNAGNGEQAFTFEKLKGSSLSLKESD